MPTPVMMCPCGLTNRFIPLDHQSVYFDHLVMAHDFVAWICRDGCIGSLRLFPHVWDWKWQVGGMAMEPSGTKFNLAQFIPDSDEFDRCARPNAGRSVHRSGLKGVGKDKCQRQLQPRTGTYSGSARNGGTMESCSSQWCCTRPTNLSFSSTSCLNMWCQSSTDPLTSFLNWQGAVSSYGT